MGLYVYGADGVAFCGLLPCAFGNESAGLVYTESQMAAILVFLEPDFKPAQKVVSSSNSLIAKWSVMDEMKSTIAVM